MIVHLNRQFAFVYAKDGQYKVFNLDEQMKYADYLKTNGWKHLKTVDALQWIEALIQHQTNDQLDMINDLKK